MLKRITYLLCFTASVFCWKHTGSQGDSLHARLYKEFRNAESVYKAATDISFSKHYDADKEAALNHKALEQYNALYKKLPLSPEFDSIRFITAFKTGELQHYFEQYDKALEGYNESIKLKLNSTLPDSFLFRPYLFAGMIYYNRNRYDTAADYFSRAEQVQRKYNHTLQDAERLYNIMGVLHYQKGDYRQAKNHFLKAAELLPKNHPYYKDLLVNYRINLAQIFYKLEDYEGANAVYQELLQSGVNQNEINHNLGMINLSLGAGDKALQYFRKVFYSNNKIIRLYNNMGEAFLYLGQTDSARSYYEKAIQLHQSFGANSDPIGYGLALKNRGELEVKQANPASALSFYQSALHQFYPAFSDTSAAANPQTFSGVFSYINLFNTLVLKAEALHELYERTNSVSYANRELEAYRSSFRLIDYVERTYNSDEARLFINRIKYLVHSKPIDIAFDLYKRTGDKKYLEQLYVFDQQNKATILSLQQESIRTSRTDTVLTLKEQELKSAITRLSIQAAQVQDSIQLEKLNREIRDLEISLGNVQEDLAEKSGGSRERIPTVPALQKDLLQKGSVLLSYHLSNNKLTTLVIRKTSLDCRQDILPSSFHNLVQQYLVELKNPTVLLDTAKNNQLYSLLFSGITLDNVERIIIIPDDELNYLSFESLRDETGTYLAEKFSVQYQYSTALLQAQQVDFSDYQTLGFAPFAQNEWVDSAFQFSTLPNSWKEIEGLEGNQYRDSMATKQRFLQELPGFSVLHLATHAIVSNKPGELSFIAFSPYRNTQASDFLLYEPEIAQLPLGTSSLIILSACETGAGDLEKGEGIMSLSRAFRYAGCPNIITSLWNANDFSTAYLTGKLHHYLGEGYSIDKALRRAKLDYLKDKTINPRMKHPFYWSHLVFIGNYSREKDPLPWFVLSVILVVSGSAVWLITKKLHRRAKLRVS